MAQVRFWSARLSLYVVTNPSISVDIGKSPHFIEDIRLIVAKRTVNQIDVYLVLLSFDRTSYLSGEILCLLTDENLLTKIVLDPRQKLQQVTALFQRTNQSLCYIVL